MALTSTTLAQNLNATDDEFLVTSGTDFAADRLLRVDSEFMLVRSVTNTTLIRVWRGQCGTKAVAHDTLALAVVGKPEDFPPLDPWHMYTYGADGAITVAEGLHRIAKASAAALTLRAPTANEEGMRLLIVSNTAYLHSITLDSGFFNGATDPQILMVAAIGAAVELVAIGGSWCITSGGATTKFNLPSRSASVSPSASESKSASVSPSKSASVSPSVSESSSASKSPSKSPSVSPSASA